MEMKEKIVGDCWRSIVTPLWILLWILLVTKRVCWNGSNLIATLLEQVAFVREKIE
jgi:hypothetical protein